MIYENVFIFSGQLSQKSAEDKLDEVLEIIKKEAYEKSTIYLTIRRSSPVRRRTQRNHTTFLNTLTHPLGF